MCNFECLPEVGNFRKVILLCPSSNPQSNNADSFVVRSRCQCKYLWQLISVTWRPQVNWNFGPFSLIDGELHYYCRSGDQPTHAEPLDQFEFQSYSRDTQIIDVIHHRCQLNGKRKEETDCGWSQNWEGSEWATKSQWLRTIAPHHISFQLIKRKRFILIALQGRFNRGTEPFPQSHLFTKDTSRWTCC